MTDEAPERPAGRAAAGDRRAALLAVLLALQALCAVFFVADVVSDFKLDGIDAHNVFEGVIALTLVLGVILGGVEMRRTLERNQRAEAALSAASGAFAELIEERFGQWGLTPAESDVAMLALKGFDVAEIAGFRGAAAGTVRAQLARIYAKAGVSSRTQLVALFIEELLGGPVAPRD